MATVVNLGRDPRYEMDLTGFGKGMSAAIIKQMDTDETNLNKIKRVQALQNTLSAMQKAGSRDKALEIAFQSDLIEDPKDVQELRRYVDELYPPGDETPSLTTFWNKDTGEEQKGFFTKKQLRESATAGEEAILGPGNTLSKPEIETFYKFLGVGDGYEVTGRRPITKRMPNEFTLKEMDLELKRRADERAGKTAERQATAAERAAGKKDESTERLDLTTEEAFKRNVADLMNFKRTLGVDGSISIDFSGEAPERQQQFVRAMKMWPQLKNKHGRKALEAATEAVETVGYSNTRKPAPAPVEAGQESAIKRMFGGDETSVARKMTDKEKAKAPAATPSRGREPTPAKPTASGQARPVMDVTKEFNSDPQMKGATLGQYEPGKGYKVFRNNKLIGYYN